MPKKDITISDPCIAAPLTVYRGAIPRTAIPMKAKGRVGDGWIFILEGKCHYTFDDGVTFTASKHDILYLANNARYAMDVDCDQYEFYVINFAFADPDPRQSAVYHPRDKAGTEQLFARLCARRDLSSPSAVTESLSLFYRIFTAIIESRQSHYIGGKNRSAMESAAEVIHAECHDPSLSVTALAARAAMSEVHFRRLFAVRFGISPARYIMRARVSRAKELMSMSTLSLADIAEQSGFSSPTYFYRVFREIVGTTPATYRRELMEHPL